MCRKTEKMKFNYANIMLLQIIRYIAFVVLWLNFSNLYGQTGLGIHTVVIDPGHGGKDPGAIGAKKNMEKTVVLNVSLMLGDLIKKNFPDVNVVYTRDDDRFIGLARRAKIANEIGADLLFQFMLMQLKIERQKDLKVGYWDYTELKQH